MLRNSQPIRMKKKMDIKHLFLFNRSRLATGYELPLRVNVELRGMILTFVTKYKDIWRLVGALAA